MSIEIEAPDGIAALVAWLSPLGVETRGNRKPGAALPYLMVTRPARRDDQINEFGTYRIHAFHQEANGFSALKNASDLAFRAHYRILGLCPKYGPQKGVTMPDGRVAYADGVTVMEGPTWERYVDDGSIERFVTDYRIDWRYYAKL